MLKFFRKIRRRLLSENSFSKYLLYAIGEIFLVVVGILIALQVNNWNDDKKSKAEEVKMLQSFQKTLVEDIRNQNAHIAAFNETKASIDILINHLEHNLQYHDSLNIHFGNTTNIWSPTINTDVFKTLQSININLISSDQLKERIIAYYSFAENIYRLALNRYSEVVLTAGKEVFDTRFNAFWNSNYEDIKGDFVNSEFIIEMIPNDYESLRVDVEYLYFLRSLKNQLLWFMEVNLDSALSLADNLLNQVEREIRTLEGSD